MADSNFNTTTMTNLVKTAYDRMAYNALRPELYMVAFAKVKPTMQTQPGSPVVFNFYGDHAAQTTALNETTDPETISVSMSTVSVTLAEYGAVSRTTKKYRGLSMVPAPDRDVAELIGYNAGLSHDTLARDVLVAGSNVVYAGTATARNQVSANENIVAADVAYAVAKMRGANVKPWAGGKYVSLIHPDVAVDLRSETGDGSWVSPANYSDAQRRWNGDVGSFAGAQFIEASRAPYFTNAGDGSGGAGNIDVYATLFMGQECLAMAYSKPESAPTPQFVIGPVTDALNRHHLFGWYWMGGFARFREEALYRIEAASTIGNNAS